MAIDLTHITASVHNAEALLVSLRQQISDLAKQLADAIAANDPAAQVAVQKALDDLATELDTVEAPPATPAVPPATP